MKHLVIGASALILAACASGPSAYGPAYGSSDLGYENTRIQQDRFRISYTSRNANESKDLVLLRAAEIAEAEGYSHFKVINGSHQGRTGGSPISSSIGVGRSVGGYRGGRTAVGVGVGVRDVASALEGDKHTETIEVILMNMGGSDPNIYEAASIKKYIRPSTFKTP